MRNAEQMAASEEDNENPGEVQKEEITVAENGVFRYTASSSRMKGLLTFKQKREGRNRLRAEDGFGENSRQLGYVAVGDSEVMVELSHTEEGKIIPIDSALRDAIHRKRQ